MQHKLDPIAEFIQYDNGKPALNSSGLPVLAPVRVFRTIEDVKLLIEQNAPLNVVELFAKDASEAEQWQFAHEYIAHLEKLTRAEAYNTNLPVIGKDDNGGDVLAEPVELPEPPEKPSLKTIDEVLAPFGRELFKKLRAERVGNLTVEVDGLVFDGDELSTDRMNQRIQIMSDTDTISWTLANNEVQEVTKAQLFNAFKLAVDEQSKLWN